MKYPKKHLYEWCLITQQLFTFNIGNRHWNYQTGGYYRTTDGQVSALSNVVIFSVTCVYEKSTIKKVQMCNAVFNGNF